MLSNHPFLAMMSLPILLAVAGCGETVEPIENYRVPKSDAVYRANHIAAEEAKPVKGRMLVAMIIDGPRTWYFKLMGPDEKIDGKMTAFSELVASIKFQGETPTWKTPAGWKQLPDDDPKNTGFVPRLATILVDDDKNSPELTVTNLPTAIQPEPGKSQTELEDEFVLINVNRWRNQLQMKPATQKNLYASQEAVSKKPLEEVVKKIIDGRTMLLVHLTGMILPPGAGRGGPFMGMGR